MFEPTPGIFENFDAAYAEAKRKICDVENEEIKKHMLDFLDAIGKEFAQNKLIYEKQLEEYNQLIAEKSKTE